MPKSHRPYAPEFRRQMVDLVRSGRTPEALSREFEPTAPAIWNWVRQADRDEGRRHDGPTNAEREELTRLRRENRQLRQERDILAKAAAWFARETAVIPSGSPIHEREPGLLRHRHHGTCARGVDRRLLRLAFSPPFGTRHRR
jgi:transposase